MSERAYGKEHQFDARFPLRKRKVLLYCFCLLLLLTMANYSNLSNNLQEQRDSLRMDLKELENEVGQSTIVPFRCYH